tara:strand:- start:1231 stop:1830 length:600 start_codon:yes stop_codon:yes gene_type:complete
MKYKIIDAETIKNVIEFLDEIQFDAASESSAEDMQKVNFCNWAINELLNSYDVMTANELKKDKKDKKPKKNKRDDIIDEHFFDWELPEMSDEEFEKLVNQFDAFLRGWEKEYNKNNPKKKPIKERKEKEFKPQVNDVLNYMSLEEVKKYLLEDFELTPEEKFELYYHEWERVNSEKEGFTLEEMLKDLNINLPPKDEKN